MLALNRAEFRTALDPRNESREATRKVVDEQLKLFDERFARVSQTKDDRARAMMPDIKDAYVNYRKSIDSTFQLAEASKNASLSESSMQLRERALESRGLAETLQAKMRAASDLINQRTERMSKESTELY